MDPKSIAPPSPPSTPSHSIAHSKFRNPVRVRSGYQLRVRLGDWAGHGPAYLAIVNTGFKGPPTEAAGVPLPDGCLWDFFGLDGAKLQAALGCACEVVVASPGVRKTSLVLCQRVQAEFDTGGVVLVVTPTTVSRSQAVTSLSDHGLNTSLRVLGAQKLIPIEEP